MENITITKKLFGGNIDFIIYNVPLSIVEEIVEKVYIEGLRLQKIFNMYDSNSELSLLNKLRNCIVSNEFINILNKALMLSELTSGSYDVALGKSILLKKHGKIAAPKCSYKDISIKKNNVTLTSSDVLLDFGSIAKGYITDRLANILKKNGVKEFLIDARGDILVVGKHAHIFGIQHPRNEGNICSIKIKNQAVATSGDYMQYVKKFNKSHIINQKGIISVTVVARTLEEADLYATAIFTSSSEDINKIINFNKNIKVLIIKKGNNLIMLNDFKKIMYCNEK